MQKFNVTLWYPTDEDGKPATTGENAVFEGVVAQQDAPIAEVTLPVVVISQGGLRAAPNFASWIGAGLATKGWRQNMEEAR